METFIMGLQAKICKELEELEEDRKFKVKQTDTAVRGNTVVVDILMKQCIISVSFWVELHSLFICCLSSPGFDFVVERPVVVSDWCVYDSAD